MLNIDADTALRYLAFEQLVPALAQAFKEGCKSPLRHQHQGVGHAANSTLLLMPAWSDDYIGIKVVNVFPDNEKRDISCLHAAYLLCHAETGEQLAMIDGGQITDRRTAAASALGASYLAREDAKTLLVLGTGRIGSLMAHAYRSVRPIERVLVWNRTPANAQALVETLSRDRFDAEVVDDLEEAAGLADCITSATLTTEPLIHGEWLRPGVHVDLIGGFTPAMREADDAVLERGSVFIDTSDALKESGDLISPMNNGTINDSSIQADLESLCKHEHPGRRDAHEVTVFKSVGTALEDLAGAKLVYESYRATQNISG